MINFSGLKQSVLCPSPHTRKKLHPTSNLRFFCEPKFLRVRASLKRRKGRFSVRAIHQIGRSPQIWFLIVLQEVFWVSFTRAWVPPAKLRPGDFWGFFFRLPFSNDLKGGGFSRRQSMKSALSPVDTMLDHLVPYFWKKSVVKKHCCSKTKRNNHEIQRLSRSSSFH